MYLFTARYRNQVQTIMVLKDMPVSEFVNALAFAMQLPEGDIVGFSDRNGKSISVI